MREPTSRKGLPAGCVAAVSIMLFALGGCRPRLLRPAVPTVTPSPEELEQELTRGRAEIHSLRGFADIGYSSSGKGRLLTGRHVVLVQRPDRFRLEAYSPFGLLGVAACDGRTLSVYDRRNSAIYRSAASADRIASYLSIAMSPSDVVSVLLGRVPERRHGGAASAGFDPSRGKFRLDQWREGPRPDIVWFDTSDLTVTMAELETVTGRRVEIAMKAYGLVGGVLLPHRIEVAGRDGGGRLRIAYEDPVVNAAIPSGAFEIPASPGVREVPLDQRAGTVR